MKMSELANLASIVSFFFSIISLFISGYVFKQVINIKNRIEIDTSENTTQTIKAKDINESEVNQVGRDNK